MCVYTVWRFEDNRSVGGAAEQKERSIIKRGDKWVTNVTPNGNTCVWCVTNGGIWTRLWLEAPLLLREFDRNSGIGMKGDGIYREWFIIEIKSTVQTFIRCIDHIDHVSFIITVVSQMPVIVLQIDMIAHSWNTYGMTTT